MDKNLIKKVLEAIRDGKELTSHDLGIDKNTYGETVEWIQDKKYIKDATVKRAGHKNVMTLILTKHAKITPDGRKWLEENE